MNIDLSHTDSLRAWVFSDIHSTPSLPTDVYQMVQPHSDDYDIIIIAGDLANGVDEGLAWLNRQQFKKPVFFVAGNHDFYFSTWRSAFSRFMVTAKRLNPNLHFLEDDTAVVKLKSRNVSITGATLWTSYKLTRNDSKPINMRRAEETLSDHRFIYSDNAKGGRWRASDAASKHRESVRYITAILDATWRGFTVDRRVVITHHAPSIMSIHDRYANSLINSAFVTPLDKIVAKADLWIHGHVHDTHDYMIENCRVVCNPLGYNMTKKVPNIEFENANFNPRLIVDI